MDWSSELLRRRRFLVHVKPNARKTAILSYDEEGDFFTVSVKAPPVEGKANEELERHFTKLLKKKVVVKTGHSSKKKMLAFE